MRPFEGKRILITGGTGSLGKVLVRRILSGEMGTPAKVIVFSRDEAKQHAMRTQYQFKTAATDEIIYRNSPSELEFRIGDVRDFHGFAGALHQVDIVFHAAALKQVPTCEYYPYEAVQTNILGAENLIRAIHELNLSVETVVGISTDKACKPINTMGMTKAIQERILIQANLRCQWTRFLCARYGNVLASRGSVIPLFHEQIRNGGPVTITTPEMTRFLLSLDDAVDTIFAAVKTGKPGETYVPNAVSAQIKDVASALIGERKIEIKYSGIRPGEKIHEILISEEEAFRTVERGGWFAILPMLPELRSDQHGSGVLTKEFSSADSLMTPLQTARLLMNRGLMLEDQVSERLEVMV